MPRRQGDDHDVLPPRMVPGQLGEPRREGSKVVDYEIGRWRNVVPIMRKGRFHAVDRFMRETDPNARVQLAGDIGPIPGVNGALVSGQAAGDRIVDQLAATRSVRA